MDYQSIVNEGEEEAFRIVDEHEVHWKELSREYEQTNKQWEEQSEKAKKFATRETETIVLGGEGGKTEGEQKGELREWKTKEEELRTKSIELGKRFAKLRRESVESTKRLGFLITKRKLDSVADSLDDLKIDNNQPNQPRVKRRALRKY